MSNLTDRLEGARASLAIKAPCRVATTAAITLSGFQTIDGVTLAEGDANLRVLVKNQTSSAANGIYIASSGTWQRARDFDGNADFVDGTRVIVAGGTVGNGMYELVCTEPVTVGTTALTFQTAVEQARYYAVTSLETAASVTPTDYTHPPGDFRRYGADPTGFANSSTAISNALKSGHVARGGGRFAYKTTSTITLTTSCRIDLEGATLKPTGDIQLFYRSISATATTTVSSGATVGSRQVVVASATGLAVGQRVKILADDYKTATVTISNASPGVITWTAHGLYVNCPIGFTTTGGLPSGLSVGSIYYVKTILSADTFTVSSQPGGSAINTSSAGSGTHTAIAGNDTFCYPAHWAKIRSIAGTTITLDRPLSVTYFGTVSFKSYASTTHLNEFVIENGVLDGSASTSDSIGEAIRVAGFVIVDIRNCTFLNWTEPSTDMHPVSVLDSIDVKFTGLRSEGQANESIILLAYECQSVKYRDLTIDTSSFGGEAVRCESASFIGNDLRGRRMQEDDESLGTFSVRGIKTYGCYASIFTGNTLYDFDSPIRIQCGFRYVITGNIIKNTTTGIAFSGSIAINVGSDFAGANMVDGLIENNIVDGGWGSGIGVTSSPIGRVIINGNIVRNVLAIGIYAPIANPIITANRIEDWGLRNSSDDGIYHGGYGGTIKNNRFSHATLTSLNCIRNSFGNGFIWDIDGNTSESGNPLGAVFENASLGQIGSGNTFTTVTHGLSWTPNVWDIIITPAEQPTNPPGLLNVDTITSTTFRVRCAADPGASNLDFGWKAKIRMPVTA